MRTAFISVCPSACVVVCLPPDVISRSVIVVYFLLEYDTRDGEISPRNSIVN